MAAAGTVAGGRGLRAFIAFPLPAECQAALGALQQLLRPQLPGVRWASPESIHLTLVFLGSVPEENLEKITAVMLSVGSAFAPFVLTVRGIGAFPSWQHPRVVWAGVAAVPQLVALQADLSAGLAQFGFPGDARPYVPHLTLGRCRSGGRGAVPDSGRAEAGIAVVPADRLILYESRLQSAGAQHIPLKTQFLGRNGGADEPALPAGV
ncbi:MAG: 2'-5' RNA ligase [Desulfuromonadales bacterium GWD2_61_12]|nr:MAG: 2'-5' RNA ligase [Desulfuromonadales bacterium GWC2_61_20]OGR36755.1 MAG: 2'-5' RNA ligase [Desulfuromonadales bacterium GWD2_61_12]HAD04021.1 RNA 2',3'-cyclic phosphodiesterase [Desulfuromonas sp.]HBT83283.1 RNA 2',3'-cyclic phosphodiesterase [Desulfuromonas sp.]